MMTTIERRLKSLRDVAFQEEQDYHQLILAEKDINVSSSSICPAMSINLTIFITLLLDHRPQKVGLGRDSVCDYVKLV